MNSTIFFVVVIFIGFLLFNFYQNKKRNDILNSLIGYLNAQDYDGFYKASEDIQVKRFIPDYNINYLRLSAALMQDDKNKIEKFISEFDDIKMTDEQKKALYERCFYYYVEIDEKNKAEKYYQLLMSINNIDKKMYTYFYDTYVLKGSTYLEELLEQLDSLNNNQKPIYYNLIADIYHNLNDSENASKYEELLKDIIKN